MQNQTTTPVYRASYAPDVAPPPPAPIQRASPPAPYVTALSRLSPADAELVWRRVAPRLSRDFVLPPDALPQSCLFVAIQSGVTQPDLVLSLIRETAPESVHALEALVGRPITREAPRQTKAPPRRAADRARAEADEQTIVRLLVDKNPKKPGSLSADRFSRYRDGMTVAEALTAGLWRGDIKWDSAHDFIRLEKRENSR